MTMDNNLFDKNMQQLDNQNLNNKKQMRNYFSCLNFWVKTVPGFKIKIDEIFIHYILKI